LATIDGAWQGHAWRPRPPAPTGEATAPVAATATPAATSTPRPPSPTHTAEPPTPTAAPTPAPTREPPTPTPTPTAAPKLPDLALRDVRIEYEGRGACVPAWARLGTTVEIVNIGQAAAGPFRVEVNGQTWRAPGGLEAAEVGVFWFGGAMLGIETTVSLDVDRQVDESDEGNNAFAQVLPLRQLPPCAPY
jgi:hypothetical protein